MTARDGIIEFVRAYPGLHVRELSRRLGVAVRVVEYHAAALTEEGRIAVEHEGVYHRLFPTGARTPTDAERPVIGLLRKTTPFGIIVALLDSGPTTHSELAQDVGVSRPNLTHHLQDLMQASIVAQLKDGRYAVIDPAWMRRLLRRYKPLPDLIDQFSATWNHLYGVPPP